jgi:O-antigen/teichoic acid export membrane protein
MTTDQRPSTRVLATRLLLGRGVARDLMVAQLAAAAASLVVNVVAARGMGPAGRGALAFFLQLTYVGSALSMAGADRALPALRRPTPGLRTAEGEVLRLLLPSFVLSAVAALVWAVGSSEADGEGAWRWTVAVAFFVALWGNVSLVALRTAAITAQQSGRYLTITVAGQAALVAGALGLLVVSVESVDAWLLLYGAAFLVPAAIAVLVRRPDGRVSRPDLQAARTLGLRLTPMVLANMITLRSDRIILPIVGDATQLGLYVIVATVTELLAWPVQNVVDARVPGWRARLEEGRLDVAKLFAAVTAYAAAGAVGIALALHVLLVPVFGAAYEQSTRLIWPLAVAAGLYAVSRVGIAVCVAANRAARANLIDLSGTLVAVPGYLLLIPGQGAAGAALATLLAYGTAAVVSVLVSWRVTTPLPGPRTAAPVS